MSHLKDKPLSLIEHLEELRFRIIKVLVAILITTIISYRAGEKVISFLARPVGKLVFISPQEAFITKIKIALFLGTLLASPFIIFQIWQFISVGLRKNEKKYALAFGPFSFLLFLTGILFGYLIITPLALNFLLGFTSPSLSPMLTISRYVSFVFGLSLAFGLIFQLPLILLFLAKIGLVELSYLKHKRREAIVLVFIMSAFLTPPDVITQVLMALPLILLYELGLILVGYSIKTKS